MILANVAFLLARDYALDVIVVDWDLEAPGLHRYFGLTDRELGPGVIDYFQDYKALLKNPKRKITTKDLSIERYLQPVERFLNGGSIQILGAGSEPDKPKYAEAVRSFNWDNFYREWNGAQVVEGLRLEFKDLADICLIDSRTGITDIGGICTVQMPDTVVFVFALNDQNILGIEQIARELTSPNNKAVQAIKRRPELLFVASRKELSEVGKLREWEQRAADTFGKYCYTPAVRENFDDVASYLRKTSIPYVPYYAYGEEIAAKSPKGIELAESLKPLIQMITGRPFQSGAHRRNRLWETMKRYLVPATIFVFSFSILAVLGAAGYWLFHFVSDWLSNIITRPEFQKAFPDFTNRFVLGSAGGTAGGALFSFMRFYASYIRKGKFKISDRSSVIQFYLDFVGGGIVGAVAAILNENGNTLLIGFISGFFFPILVDRLFPKSED